MRLHGLEVRPYQWRAPPPFDFAQLISGISKYRIHLGSEKISAGRHGQKPHNRLQSYPGPRNILALDLHLQQRAQDGITLPLTRPKCNELILQAGTR